MASYAESAQRPPVEPPDAGMQRHEKRISPGIIVQAGAYTAVMNLYQKGFMQPIKQAAKEGYAVLYDKDAVEFDAMIMDR